MDTRSRAPWATLAAANLGVIVFVLLLALSTGLEFFPTLLVAISIGQLSILSVWLAFGDSGLLLRLILYFILGGLVVSIGSTSFTFSGVSSPAIDVVLPSLVVVALFALVVSLPLSAYSWRGWRIIHHENHGNGEQTFPWQLSIRFLLTTTLMVALMMPLNKYVTSMGTVDNNGRIGFPPDEYNTAGPIINSVTLLGLGLSIVTSVWGCLAVTGVYSSSFVTLICMALVLAIPMHVRLGSIAHIQWIAWLSCAFATLLSSLLFLRIKGLRLVKLVRNPR